MKFLFFFFFAAILAISCKKKDNGPTYTATEKLLIGKWYLQKEVDSEGYWNSSYDTTWIYTGYGKEATILFSPDIVTNYGSRRAIDSSGLDWIVAPADISNSSFLRSQVWQINPRGNCIYWYHSGADSLFIVRLDSATLVLEDVHAQFNDTSGHSYWYYAR